MKKFVLLISVIIVAFVGYFVMNMFQLSFTDKIFVGQMAMERADIVVGRDTEFEKYPTPTIDAQLLFSISKRFENNTTIPQSLVVTNSNGEEVFRKDFVSNVASNVIGLHPIQQTAGEYHLSWYWADEVIVTEKITIK